MSDTIKLRGASIKVHDYAASGNAILGIRDSGKTYTATFMAEQLLKAGIPFVAFDPIGVWRYLTFPGKRDGYPVAVASPDDENLKLTPQTAVSIVRAAMKENIPLVLDLYSMQLSKADWKRIVTDCVRLLLYENKLHGLRHIFLEEASEFAPQRVMGDNAVVYAEIEKLARMGGNASLGYTLINQRAEELNKAVLELCDRLFLHRQKGRRSLQNLEKWLEVGTGNEDRKQLIQQLPKLPQGTCYLWDAGSDTPVRVEVPEKDSLHPDRRNLNTNSTSSVVTQLKVNNFLCRIKASLEEQEATSKASRARRQGAEKSAAQKPVQAAAQQVKEVSVLTDADSKQLEDMAVHLKQAAENIELWRLDMKLVRAAFEELHKEIVKLAAQHDKLAMKLIDKRLSKNNVKHVQAVASSPASRNGSLKSGGGIERMMVALAQRPGLTRNQLGLRAALSSRSGTFSNYLSVLRTNGWLNDSNGKFELTSAGLAQLGNYEALPEGMELAQHYIQELGGGVSRILQVLVDAYPDELTREEIGERTGMSSKSGTFSNYLSKLRTLELITGKQALKATDEFFN